MTREIVVIKYEDFLMDGDWERLCMSLGVMEYAPDVEELVIEYVRAGKSEDELETIEEIIQNKKAYEEECLRDG